MQIRATASLCFVRVLVTASIVTLGLACFVDGGDELGTTDTGPDDTGEATVTDTGESGLPAETGSDDETDTGTEPDLPSPATDTGETTGPGDTTPPEVVSIDPSHGSVNVIDQPVRIVFSEIMNTESVELAFPDASGFVWSNSDTMVEFELPFPFEDEAVLHDIVVPPVVEDLAGNTPESEVRATVSLAALVSATLEYEPALTGHVCDGCVTFYSFFLSGDKNTNTRNFGGISFALDSLPPYASVIALRSATYATQVINMYGDPNNPGMGGFFLDHVEFDAGSEFSSPTVHDLGFYDLLDDGDFVIGEPIEVDVTAQLESSWASDASRFQLRVRPSQALQNDAYDDVYFRRAGDENDGIVHVSVNEPDASNRARVEVQYFVE